jgi:tyrosyl-tRNA synthetase
MVEIVSKKVTGEVERQFEIIRRGTAEVITEEELKSKLAHSIETGKPLKVKEGFDPTAPDIHLGHTVTLRKLRQFQDLGHQVIFLIGDFTGLIGDPSGRDTQRKRMTAEEVKQNAETYKRQVFKILDPDKTVIDFNSRWLRKMSFEEVLGLCAHCTVARILERDDFLNRYREGKPISMLEFLYPLAQGYDSVALEADVELGGTDQKFNLLVGRELQRDYGQEPQVIITMPLLVGTDGTEKMSKSTGNYVGINESPKEIYGKTMSIPDGVLYDYYLLLTDLPQRELDRIRSELEGGKKNPMEHKRALAHKIVSTYHGEDAASQAAAEFDRIFSQKGLPDEIPLVKMETQDESLWIVKILTDSGSCKSGSEARRLIKQGGVYVDGDRIDSPDMELDISRERLVKVGKRKFLKVVKA